MGTVSAIKLNRTDTTHDLSQKAEKGMTTVRGCHQSRRTTSHALARMAASVMPRGVRLVCRT